MKCFIGSAFGRKDVDEIYDGCIVPVLRQLSVQALRVDRVEHNDDIDNKIMQLLEQAHFCIADLTYARPSVYFEAGYAAGRGKPVIYTARNDHFRARDNDPEGLQRVHFDLQMKNIIPWADCSDDFSKRLAKRLAVVLRPLLRQRTRKEELETERANFTRLPQDSKIAGLRKEIVEFLKPRSFSFPAREMGKGLQSYSLLAVREFEGRSQQLSIFCTDSAVKKDFRMIGVVGSWEIEQPRDNLPIDLHYFVVSLQHVPRSRPVQALSAYQSLEDGTLHRRFAPGPHRSPIDVFVHVISGIQSTSEFTDAFQAIVTRYGLSASKQA